MNDGVGMTPNDEGTETATSSSTNPRKVGDGEAAGKTTAVTGWSGAADREAGAGGTRSPGTDRDAEAPAGPGTLGTFDPAMADQPAEGGVEEAEE